MVFFERKSEDIRIKQKKKNIFLIWACIVRGFLFIRLVDTVTYGVRSCVSTVRVFPMTHVRKFTCTYRVPSCTVRQLNLGLPCFAYWRWSRVARIPIGFARTPATHSQTRVAFAVRKDALTRFLVAGGGAPTLRTLTALDSRGELYRYIVNFVHSRFWLDSVHNILILKSPYFNR